MESFKRRYSHANRELEVHILDPIGTGVDTQRIALLIFENGERFSACFWTDPMNRGTHWWEEAGMAIVQDLETSRVLQMVDEALANDILEERFAPVPTHWNNPF
jgi:hypothetical protein